MPSSKNYVRDYQQEQKTAKARGEDKDKAKRNKARRDYEKAHGNLPSNVDVDHKKKLAQGGGNSMSNLRARSQSANRSDNLHKKGEK